ncbi:MAG: C2 domain-containing protein [Flavobacteriales bacterium]|nr:C2 domain-containing protein [Flavobacteriales bacterium]
MQVGEIRILPDSEVKSAKGILFRFPASYSYSENELFSTTEKSGTISYRLVLTHPTGYDVYFPLDNMPRKQAEITDNPVKNATASLSIFVPYTLLSLSEGMHEMQYRLDAQTLDGSVTWPRLREGNFRFSMPRLYLTQARVDSISVAQGTYDVAAKDIPLVNLFVGRKSKAGKGLPDLFWVLKSNGLEVLRTSVAQNSLYAPDKSGNFQMMEDEILALTVYDHDLISRNDVMGSFEFPKLQGETRWTKSGLTSQYVKSGRIEVMRKVRPDCPDLQFSIESLKQEGITGYLVQLSPPESRNAEVKNIHILSAEGLVHKTVPLRDFQANAQNRLHYFMPAWEWPANAQTTVTITDTEWNIPICGFTAFPEKNITQTDDITLHWKKPQEVEQNGVYGLQIEVWTEYGFDPKYLNDMRFECQMSDKNKTYFSTSGALNQWVNTSNLQQPNTFFIPYRAFENKENTTTRLKVNLNTTHSQSGFITGTLTDSAEVQLEALQEVPELEFTALAKFKKGMKSLKMITVQGSMGEEKIREIPADVNIHQTLRFPVERIHAKDELSVRFVAEYTNGKTLQGGVSFTLKDLEKTGEKSMAKAGLLKKVVIRRK